MKNRKRKNLTLWFNGNIITMDEEKLRAGAFVTENEKITFVGTTEEADRQSQDKGLEINRIDLAGKTVVPGFNDNHVHAVMFGEHLLQPDISGMDNEQIVAQI